jgi:hypothetical protein
MTHIYLMWDREGSEALARYPSVLVAFPHLRAFDAGGPCGSRLILDSGAFSAWNSGTEIDLDALTREAKRPRWTESVGLDVIGDWRGSKANAIRSMAMGSTAMPVFHVGDPWDLLEFYCLNWPKVGLGGMVGTGGCGSAVGIRGWLDEAFARAWPHRFHAFGQTGAQLLLSYPFHSADSSSWAVPVLRNRDYVHIRGAKVGKAYGIPRPQACGLLRYNIDRYAALADRLASHWRRELAQARSTCEYSGD